MGWLVNVCTIGHTTRGARVAARARPSSIASANPPRLPHRRQKTVDVKTYCGCQFNRRGQEGGPNRGTWCGDCLMTRMGENIHEVRWGGLE